VTSKTSESGAWLDRTLGAAAAVLLFGLMAVTTIDVIGRYIFNWPLRGGFELTELLLLTLVFAGLPLVSRADEHVTMDFIDGLLGPRGRSFLRRLVDVVCGIIILALAWRVFIKAGVSEATVQQAVPQLQQAAAEGDNPPLLVMIDQEGGEIKPLPGAPDTSPADLGRSGDSETARTEGQKTGQYLKPFGINIDLAPVLDVELPQTAETIGSRTFGDDPNRVADLGSAFIDGIQSQQVAATAKHFPGLGPATINTDFAAVSVRATDEQFQEALVPFQAAVDAGVKLVMVSSAAYPNYAGATPGAGKVKPAAFATPIVQGMLREQLGFTGVVITDDLESIAIKELTTRDAAAIAALRAGCDLALYARTLDGASAGLTAVVKAMKQGKLDRAVVQQAYDRVQDLKESLPSG